MNPIHYRQPSTQTPYNTKENTPVVSPVNQPISQEDLDDFEADESESDELDMSRSTLPAPTPVTQPITISEQKTTDCWNIVFFGD